MLICKPKFCAISQKEFLKVQHTLHMHAHTHISFNGMVANLEWRLVWGGDVTGKSLALVFTVLCS